MRSISCIFIFIILSNPLAYAQSLLMDPDIPADTNLIYSLEDKEHPEYSIFVDVIETSNGKAYLIASHSTHLSTLEEDRAQTLYQKNNFTPISYKYSYKDRAQDLHYYEEIIWNWEAKEYQYTQIFHHDKENKKDSYSSKWEQDPYLALPLIYNGLLCGLPINNANDKARLKLSTGKHGAAVNFRVVSTETIAVEDRNILCYKIEAAPDLGPFLNLLLHFWGNPKSYLWLTTSKPRLITKAHIKTPWDENLAVLKKVSLGKNKMTSL